MYKKKTHVIRNFQNKTAASVAWPGPVGGGQSPDSDGTAPGGSILIHLPADPHKKWTKKNKASVNFYLHTHTHIDRSRQNTYIA